MKKKHVLITKLALHFFSIFISRPTMLAHIYTNNILTFNIQHNKNHSFIQFFFSFFIILFKRKLKLLVFVSFSFYFSYFFHILFLLFRLFSIAKTILLSEKYSFYVLYAFFHNSNNFWYIGVL